MCVKSQTPYFYDGKSTWIVSFVPFKNAYDARNYCELLGPRDQKRQPIWKIPDQKSLESFSNIMKTAEHAAPYNSTLFKYYHGFYYQGYADFSGNLHPFGWFFESGHSIASMDLLNTYRRSSMGSRHPYPYPWAICMHPGEP